MARARITKLYLQATWPDDSQAIMLDAIAEEDEPPVSINDIALDLMLIFWDKEPDLGEDPKTDFIAIVYPDNIRFYYKGKRVSLNRAHQALEAGLNESLRIALDVAQAEVDNEETSHSQA